MTHDFAAMTRLMGALAAMLLASACSSAPSGPSQPSGADSLSALPRTLTVAERDAVSSGNAFALTLLKTVAPSTTRNVLLSPLSVWTALGMTMNGAAGETESEMRSTLGWGTRSRAEINTAYRDLATLLPSLDPNVSIANANGVWIRGGFTADTGFASDVRQYFGAELQSVATPQGMFDAVNSWGNTKTKGMVPKVLSEPPPDNLLMLLANAVYFEGRWRNAFDVKDTKSEPFQLEGAAAVTVPMMSRKGGFAATRNADITAVELAYGNSAYSMLVLVPNSGTVDALTARLDSVTLAGIEAALSPGGESRVYLPRFTVRGSLELGPQLRAMGMPRAFSDLAEFPRLAGISAKLSFVQHGMALQVDEAGTKAAAVTVVGAVFTSLPPSYRVDRPFVFLIRERFAGTILFAGVVRDPRQ
jgi:serpin B